MRSRVEIKMLSFFPTNEHAVDRVLRIVVGVILLSFAVVGPRAAWGYFGLLPLLTGVVGTCPVYSFFGFDTCRLTRKVGDES
jgi:hypothetical protein